MPVWPLFGVAIWKTLLPILVEPLAHCINPPIPDGDDIGFSNPELLKVGENGICENGLTLQCKRCWIYENALMH